MLLLVMKTHVDPARVHLVLQLIPTAADALVHYFLWSFAAAASKQVAYSQNHVDDAAEP